MKLKYNFVVCNMSGKTVGVAVGKDNERFNGMVNLNAGGEVIFKLLNEGDIPQEELLAQFAAHFGIAEEKAKPAVLWIFWIPCGKADYWKNKRSKH